MRNEGFLVMIAGYSRGHFHQGTWEIRVIFHLTSITFLRGEWNAENTISAGTNGKKKSATCWRKGLASASALALSRADEYRPEVSC